MKNRHLDHDDKGQSLVEYMVLLALLVLLGILISRPVAVSVEESVIEAMDVIAPPTSHDYLFYDDEEDDEDDDACYGWYCY